MQLWNVALVVLTVSSAGLAAEEAQPNRKFVSSRDGAFVLPGGYSLCVSGTKEADFLQKTTIKLVQVSPIGQAYELLLGKIGNYEDQKVAAIPKIGPWHNDSQVYINNKFFYKRGEWLPSNYRSRWIDGDTVEYRFNDTKSNHNDVDQDYDDAILVIDVKAGRCPPNYYRYNAAEDLTSR